MPKLDTSKVTEIAASFGKALEALNGEVEMPAQGRNTCDTSVESTS